MPEIPTAQSTAQSTEQPPTLPVRHGGTIRRAARAIAASRWLWLLALTAALSLHFWFPRIDMGPLHDTYSVEIGGRNAFFQLAERRFLYVDRNVAPLTRISTDLEPEHTLCVLGPARAPRPEEWQALSAWVKGGGSLLIAATWESPALDLDGLDVKVVARDSIEGTPTSTLLPAAAPLHWKTKGEVETKAAGAEVLVQVDKSPQAVRIPHGAGQVLVIASDYLFSNASLDDRDVRNGVLAFRLLEAAGATEAVVFDESLNATGTPKVVAILLDPALRPATVQALACLLLFAWLGNRRFGGRLAPASPPRTNIAEHTDALGNLYYRVRDGAGVLARYAEQFRGELRLKPGATQDERVIAHLAQRAGMEQGALRDVLEELTDALNKPRISRRNAARLIQRLARIRAGLQTTGKR